MRSTVLLPTSNLDPFRPFNLILTSIPGIAELAACREPCGDRHQYGPLCYSRTPHFLTGKRRSTRMRRVLLDKDDAD